MPRSNINSFRLARARELRVLADILSSNEVCQDVSPLLGAESKCRGGTGDTWDYEVERLLFRLSNLKHPVPSKVFDVTLELSVKVSGRCISDDEVRDPFDTLEFDMFINGRYNNDAGQLIRVVSAWHLDREPGTPGGVQKFTHPYYHFQHGGRHVWNTGFDFGAALVLEPPRLAHPPMDAILGIDFVLTNFFVSSLLGFREERQYEDMLRTAHARVWRPYAQALAQAWRHIPDDGKWKCKELWPQMTH